MNQMICDVFVNKTISECVRVQHWCHVSRRNKMKISISLCMCLLLLLLLLRCCCCRRRWLARSSFANRQDHTARQWLPFMFYIFSRPDICMRSAPRWTHTPLIFRSQLSVGLAWERHLCVGNWHVLGSRRAT